MGPHSSRSSARDKSPKNLEAQADSDLVELVRKGNTHAFGVLWSRHAEPGKAVARGYSASQDPDDLVAEAFTKIFQSIQSGKGPKTAFRAYLFTTIRNVSASWGRSSKESSSDELDDFVDPKTLEDETLAALDRSLTASAFRSLPTRWQEALWYSEVESMTVQQIAPLLGMKTNAVSALTFRAREGLRQAWIQAHISSVPEHSDCRWSIDRLGSHTRGALGTREQSRLDLHLAGCGRCSIIASEAQEVGSRLALILLPLAAGIGGAASYLSWNQTGRDSSLVAAAAPVPMPASVTTSFGASSFGATSVGATAAASTTALSTGTTLALVAVAALGLIGGGTAIAPLLNPTAQHSAIQPAAPDTDVSPLADPVDPPAVEIPLAARPPAIVDVFEPRPSSGPGVPPSPGPSPTAIPGETPGPVPTDVPTPSATPEPTPDPTPTSTPDPTPTPTATPTAPPTDPPVPVVPEAPAVGSPASGSVFNTSTVKFHGTAPRSNAGNTIEVSGGVALARTMFADSGFAGAGFTGTAFASTALANPAFAGTAFAANSFTGTIGDDGSWTVDVGPLADGTHTLDIRQRASAGTPSKPASVVVTVDTDVRAPEFALSRDPNNRIIPSAAGTAEPGATVELINASGTTLDRVSVDAAGDWSIAMVPGLGFGEQTIAARQTDPAGNVSDLTGAQTLTLKPVAILSPTAGATVDRPAIAEFAGDVWAEVQITIDGQQSQHTIADRFPLTLSLPTELGAHTLSVRYLELDNGTTRFGPALATTFTVGLAAPNVSSPVPGASFNSDTIRISGDVPPIEAGNTIEVSAGAGLKFTGTVDVDGSWSVDAGPLADGIHPLSIRQRTATDVSKPTTVAVTIDTIALPPTIALSGDLGGRLNPSAAGTAEPGATVVLVNELDAEITSTTADASGDWSIDVVDGFGFGPHSIAAKQTDTLGNVSVLTARTPFALSGIDIRSPGNGATVTRPAALDLQGIPGSGFRLELDGQLSATRYTFDLSGVAAPSLAGDLSFGVHDVAVRYADDVNGATRFGPAVGIRVTVVPAVPTVTSPAPGAVIDVDTVSFRGTLPPTDAGHAVEVSNGAGQTVSATVGFDGSWSVDADPLADGVYTFSIIQRSSTAEVSAPTTLAVTINTAPAPPGFTLVPDPNGRLFPSASGTAKPGAKVELVNGPGTTVAEATTALDGTWSIDVVGGLDFGANTLAARQTTLLGRVSDLTSPQSLTLAPLALTTMVDGQVVTGGHPLTFQGVQHSIFQLGLDGKFIGSPFVQFPLDDVDGSFSIPLPDPMAWGEHTMFWRYVEVENEIPRYGPATQISFTLAYRWEAIGLQSPAAGATVGSSTVRFSGEVGPVFEGETVEVSDSAGGVYRGVVGADMKWAVDAGPYPDGNHTFGLLIRSTTTGVVRVVPSSRTVTVDTTVLPPAFTLAGNQGGRFIPSAGGSAEPGATVELFNGGAKIDQATADASGNWSVAALSGLGLGTHSITARQTDPVGNVSAFTGPTSVTLAPVQITSFVTGKSPKGAPVGFSGVAGASFQATLDGVPTGLTLSAGGTLSQNLLAGAALGSHTLGVRYSQVVGGVTVYSPASTTTFEVVPLAPVVTSPSFGATVDGNPFSITGTVPATDVGNRVEVDSFGFISRGTVGPGGSWTVAGVEVPIDATGQGHTYPLEISNCTPGGVCSIPLIFNVVVPGW